jgi:hypothetical protein
MCLSRIPALLLAIVIFSSCASIQAGLYLVSIDDGGGETILRNEPKVQAFLEHVAGLPERYAVKVFARTAVGFQFKRTKLLTHSYYVIVRSDGEFNTLSFYGTKMAFHSKGAWALDADSDKNSYVQYMEGGNRWDVQELFTEKIINTGKTAQNIIDRMGSGVRYFYRDHIVNKPNMDNCNTALDETIVFGGEI